MTEFLPISSSGHLVLFQRLFGLEEPELLFDVALHGGTLLAVIVVFWSHVVAILGDLYGLFRDRVAGVPSPGFFRRPLCRLAGWILVGTVATGVVGFCLRKPIEPLFASPSAVGIALLVTGTVLWLTSYRKSGGKEVAAMGFWDALWVGVAQGVALIPGISRSGLTISVGLFRGLRRELAGRFSFLLMIPATVGALSFEWALPARGHSPPIFIVLVGTVAAFLTGYVSLRILLGLIERGKFYRFAYYCWVMGALALFPSPFD